MGYHAPDFFTMSADLPTSTPLANATYYFGTTAHSIVNATPSIRKIIPNKKCMVTDVQLFITLTAGTNEATTLYLRKNNTTDTTLSSTLDFSGTTLILNVNNLNITMDSTDFLEFKLVTPNWVSAPTSVFVHWMITFSC